MQYPTCTYLLYQFFHIRRVRWLRVALVLILQFSCFIVVKKCPYKSMKLKLELLLARERTNIYLLLTNKKKPQCLVCLNINSSIKKNITQKDN